MLLQHFYKTYQAITSDLRGLRSKMQKFLLHYKVYLKISNTIRFPMVQLMVHIKDDEDNFLSCKMKMNYQNFYDTCNTLLFGCYCDKNMS
jgi:hypothetical protein